MTSYITFLCLFVLAKLYHAFSIILFANWVKSKQIESPWPEDIYGMI